MDDITYFGLDVHKATVCVAVARADAMVRCSRAGFREPPGDPFAKWLARLGNGGRRLSICYEAGSCGYGLHRC
jgi:hypothetical protein